jgi:hypothetical protein
MDRITDHGKVAENSIAAARLAWNTAQTSGESDERTALNIELLADKATEAADEYDRIRANFVEFGPADLAYISVALALEPWYQSMVANGKRRLDEPRNALEALLEVPFYEAAQIFVRGLVMGRDYSFINPETWKAVWGEVAAGGIATSGILASAEALRRHFGLGKVEARALSMVPFTALAGAVSYAAMRKDTRGGGIKKAAARAVINGIPRYVLVLWSLKLWRQFMFWYAAHHRQPTTGAG